ncbi:hypothetical protein D3W54_02470 [Komagataeibacter medellinensis]|uniref:Transposase n=1 Tax=Komagataeibacter medellinensis TaxID=1177712 RepID=A0ABQ6VST2_9PROT|nr:hypothetical protein D3W54_02470 [Komagataeibacter medellinensis]
MFHGMRIRSRGHATADLVPAIPAGEEHRPIFFVKNVVCKHIFVVFMPLCKVRMTYSALRNMQPSLL